MVLNPDSVVIFLWEGKMISQVCHSQILNRIWRTFLVVQWLRLRASKAGVQVQSLVGELRSYLLSSQKEKYLFIFRKDLWSEHHAV